MLKKVALPSALRYQSRTMKQKLVVLLVLTLSAWSPVFSAADTPETRRKEAERYLQVSPPKALFEDMAEITSACPMLFITTSVFLSPHFARHFCTA